MKTLPFILAFASLQTLSGMDTTRLNTKITDVTVYLSGAQVTRQGEVRLKKGRQLFLIENISHQADAQSVQVAAITGGRLLSVKQSVHEQSSAQKSETEKKLERLIQQYQHRIKEIFNEKQIYQVEEKLLLDHSVPATEKKELDVNNIREAADFYRQRLNQIRKSQLLLVKEEKSLQDSIQETYARINKIAAARTSPSSRLLVEIEGLKEGLTALKFSYYVSSAGWRPLYDFRVDEITAPLVVSYNADVYQSTGEDWKNIHIKLSTYNPSQRAVLQTLRPWYLDRPAVQDKPNKEQQPGVLKGLLVEGSNGEVIPNANIILYHDREQVAAATSNAAGEFMINPVYPGRYTVKATYVGYEPAQIHNVVISEAKTSYQKIRLYSKRLVIEQLQVDRYEVPLIAPDMKAGATITREDYQNLATKDVNSVAATSAGVYRPFMRGGRAGSNLAEEVVIPEIIYLADDPAKFALTGMEYSIDLPYSVPSDGADHSIRIRDVKVEAGYEYQAVPKLETDVFLFAQIPEWHKLNLLSGKANIFFQGTYTGHTYINTQLTDDTLKINLGRDRDVIVSRSGRKQINDKKSSSSSICENMNWHITIRNNKRTPVKVVMRDQYPLAERKSIAVELIETGNAKRDERTGELTWALVLEAGEKKMVGYSYSVKYPKWARVVTE